MTTSKLPPPGQDPPGIAVLKEIGLRPGSAGSTQDELSALLLEAIDALDLAEIQRIVQHGADVNAHYCSHGIWCSGDQFVTPLMAAAKTRGSLEIVNFLLGAGADPRVEREIRTDVGYDDYKWEGTGSYETAASLAVDPEVRAALTEATKSAEAVRP